mmetsp:Transcript_19814/g.55954  ORF Transcript_19814/g.55954 Transcript_19814/m.55954 type:complete len:206 (-) Transcript_19814:1057-1674(-)
MQATMHAAWLLLLLMWCADRSESERGTRINRKSQPFQLDAWNHMNWRGAACANHQQPTTMQGTTPFAADVNAGTMAQKQHAAKPLRHRHALMPSSKTTHQGGTRIASCGHRRHHQSCHHNHIILHCIATYQPQTTDERDGDNQSQDNSRVETQWPAHRRHREMPHLVPRRLGLYSSHRTSVSHPGRRHHPAAWNSVDGGAAVARG